MKILNFDADKINACFVFCVGNCEISVSTIMNKDRAEIAVFEKEGKLLKDKIPTIIAAISWVNDFGPRD